ncbi:DNA endonuclease SmrA [Aliidiomarina iranensis]|uniref:DNA endonuclease SmrA n=1 Tax=Aliidiomarina iranensis TaxID=1434071 RepID=A0A432W354_9GAMM|nr:DNA endonuclease SmrA [Aliidiomarina iranensis]RUO23650.1 DNA endonuclease SmrA [Aliidiomarina iranensis]
MSEQKQTKNDIDLFREMMQDVKPLPQKEIATVKTPAASAESLEERRRAAEAKIEEDAAAALSEEVREWVAPTDVIGWKHDGVQDGVYRQLKRGNYEPQATLNLHRLRVSEARREVASFIQECYRTGVRTALIIHGQGLKSQPRPALLKSLCHQWLPELEPVLAIHTAQKFHGGSGASYVMIRKNSAVKLATKEQNRKR